MCGKAHVCLVSLVAVCNTYAQGPSEKADFWDMASLYSPVLECPQTAPLPASVKGAGMEALHQICAGYGASI